MDARASSKVCESTYQAQHPGQMWQETPREMGGGEDSHISMLKGKVQILLSSSHPVASAIFDFLQII